MGQEEIALIENRLRAKKVEEYDILLRKRTYFENMFLKNKVENNREVKSMEYVIRILNRTEDQVGMGIILSSELKDDRIDYAIKKCLS